MPELVAPNMEEALKYLDELSKDTDVISTIRRIEDGPKTTKYNYGEYMAFLSNFEGNNFKRIMSMALIKAGHSIDRDCTDGVRHALKIMGIYSN